MNMNSHCEHALNVRSVDLATGDQFCGDCGDVTELYTHQPDRLAGDDAVEAIAELLRRQGHKIGSVTAYGVQNVKPNAFWVNVRIVSDKERDGAAKTYSVIRTKNAATLTAFEGIGKASK
ncbi:hypothetical protein SEA_TIMINATOR_52 [Arthrobacter phage Timinator]|uniref:Uncharacterized protein n=1 Tax=Arthrobacter phage Timinator TaxID=2024006 RepID=A0A222Z0T2_9CAUD|nr:hypothetical protein SEA_TIMINATOR_52 [Arthrobacter phage Timinator]